MCVMPYEAPAGSSIPRPTMGKYWTLWSARVPVLADTFGYKPREYLTNLPARVRLSKKEAVELLEQAMGGNGPKYFGGVEADFIAVQPKDLGLEAFPRQNENILMGRNFFYNHRIERLEMDVQKIVFHGSGKVPKKTNPGVIQLSCYGGLAQILAASIKNDDILFISGAAPTVKKPEDPFRVLELNDSGSPDETSAPRTHVEIIRICFDVPKALDISLIERIRPWKNQFEFKYTSSGIMNSTVEIVRFREFNLGMGPHKLDSDIFPMPITREGNPTETFYILMADTYPNPNSPAMKRKSKSMSPKNPNQHSSIIHSKKYSKTEPFDDDYSEEDGTFYSCKFEPTPASFFSFNYGIFIMERRSCGLKRRIFESAFVFLMALLIISIVNFAFSSLPIRGCYDVEDNNDFDFFDSTSALSPAPPATELEIHYNIPPVNFEDNADAYWY